MPYSTGVSLLLWAALEVPKTKKATTTQVVPGAYAVVRGSSSTLNLFETYYYLPAKTILVAYETVSSTSHGDLRGKDGFMHARPWDLGVVSVGVTGSR